MHISVCVSEPKYEAVRVVSSVSWCPILIVSYGYSTGTQVRVPAPYIRVGSSDAFAASSYISTTVPQTGLLTQW